MDGHKMGEFTSEPGSITTSLGVKKDHVRTVTIESLGLDDDEWISLLEVSWSRWWHVFQPWYEYRREG